MARLSLSRTVERISSGALTPALPRPLRDTAISIALADQHSFSPSWVNELRAAYGSDRMAWDRAHSEVPTLLTQDDSATLPGSPDSYSYLDDTHNWQILDDATWTHRRHTITFGASILPRTWKGFQTTDRDGIYTFNTASDFENDLPISLQVGYARGSGHAGSRLSPQLPVLFVELFCAGGLPGFEPAHSERRPALRKSSVRPEIQAPFPTSPFRFSRG